MAKGIPYKNADATEEEVQAEYHRYMERQDGMIHISYEDGFAWIEVGEDWNRCYKRISQELEDFLFEAIGEG